MTVSRRFLLVRHCQALNPAPQAALTEVGKKQAEELADFLQQQPVDYIVSSVSVRAQQSILPFAQRSALLPNLDQRLDGRYLAGGSVATWRKMIKDSFEDLDFRLLGSESGREVQARAWAVVNATLSDDHVLPIFVTHGDLISLVLNSLDSSFGYEEWESLTIPDVFQLEEIDAGQWQIKRIWL